MSVDCYGRALPAAARNWLCARRSERAAAVSFGSSSLNPLCFLSPGVCWAFCLRFGQRKYFPQFFRGTCRGSKASLSTHRFFCSRWPPLWRFPFFSVFFLPCAAGPGGFLGDLTQAPPPSTAGGASHPRPRSFLLLGVFLPSLVLLVWGLLPT